MEIEALNAMKEGMYSSQMMMIEAIALITIIFAIAGIALSLAGIAWLCFEETRPPAHRQMKPAPEPPEPDKYYLSAVLAALEVNGSDGGVKPAGPAWNREQKPASKSARRL